MSEHLVVVGDSRDMREVASDSVQLIVTSPPYFNVKDYGAENIGSINEFHAYLQEMQVIFNECYRVLQKGRYICVNISDVISDEEKYPIPAHFVLSLQRAGFEYREDIIWKKPSGIGSKGKGSGATKRFGVLLQNPYPMYYFPSNIIEHILVFRKGKFDYKELSKEDKELAGIDLEEAKRRWATDLWELQPQTRRGNDHPAMFPEELPEAFIKLYTFPGETVLDPFLGSGTTLKVADKLGRKCIGYEINPLYVPLIKKKSGVAPHELKIVYSGEPK